MDISKERPQHVWLGYDENDLSISKWQLIQYKDILAYCFYCKHQGHTIDKCMINKMKNEAKRRK